MRYYTLKFKQNTFFHSTSTHSVNIETNLSLYQLVSAKNDFTEVFNYLANDCEIPIEDYYILFKDLPEARGYFEDNYTDLDMPYILPELWEDILAKNFITLTPDCVFGLFVFYLRNLYKNNHTKIVQENVLKLN